MGITALSFSIGTGLAWAGVDIARKRLGDAGCNAAVVVLLMTVGMSVAFGVYLSIVGANWPPLGYAAPFAVVVGGNVVANFAFMRSVTISPLSRTIPFLAAHPVFTALFAIPALGELPSLQQWLGILLVVYGALLVNSGESLRPGALWHAFRTERGSPLMVLAAALWGLVTPFDKRALEFVTVPEHIFAANVGIGIAMLAILLARGELGSARRLRRHSGASWAVMVFLLLAVWAQFEAYQRTLVASVEAIKRVLGVIVAFVAGRVVFGERITRGQVLALIVIGAGIWLLSGE